MLTIIGRTIWYACVIATGYNTGKVIGRWINTRKNKRVPMPKNIWPVERQLDVAIQFRPIDEHFQRACSYPQCYGTGCKHCDQRSMS